jgi:hypothetical protein
MQQSISAVVALNLDYAATSLTDIHSPESLDGCIAGIAKVVELAGIEQADTFVDWRGETLPW